LVNIPSNIRVVPEAGWDTLRAVMLAKKLSEVLQQMREGTIDFSLAKTEVEALKIGKVVVRNGFGNMVTKKPSLSSQFLLVLQHFAASYCEGGSINASFTAGMTFTLAKLNVPPKVQAEFDAMINAIV